MKGTTIKEISNNSYTILSEATQLKLLKDLEEGKIPHDDYKKISRGLNAVFFHLATLNNEE